MHAHRPRNGGSADDAFGLAPETRLTCGALRPMLARSTGHGGGVAVVVGMGPNEETSVPLSFIQTREIMLRGTFRYANTYPTAIDLAASGKVDLDAMVTSSYGLRDTEEALQASGKDPANVKPMVIPNGT